MKIKFNSCRNRINYGNYTVPITTTCNNCGYDAVEDKIVDNLWDNLMNNVAQLIQEKIREKYDLDRWT